MLGTLQVLILIFNYSIHNVMIVSEHYTVPFPAATWTLYISLIHILFSTSNNYHLSPLNCQYFHVHANPPCSIAFTLLLVTLITSSKVTKDVCAWTNIYVIHNMRRYLQGSIPEGKQVQPTALLLFQRLLCICLLVDPHEITLSIHMLKEEQKHCFVHPWLHQYGRNLLSDPSV